MSEPATENRSGPYPGGSNRRQRRPDPWRRALNYTAYVVYPLLIVNFFLFMAVASEDQKSTMAGRMARSASLEGTAEAQPEETATQRVSGWVQLYAFLPIMIVGVGIGAAGIVLDRKRARRRSDSSLMTPLVLIMMSVLGMFIYFLVRGLVA